MGTDREAGKVAVKQGWHNEENETKWDLEQQTIRLWVAGWGKGGRSPKWGVSLKEHPSLSH